MSCLDAVMTHLRGNKARAGRLLSRWSGSTARHSSGAVVGRRGAMEAIMPYLFWAVVPFEIMRIWLDACERRRENETP
jgi:hypothetical protein